MVKYVIHDMYLNSDFINTSDESYVLGALETMLELEVTHKYQCSIEDTKNFLIMKIEPDDLYTFLKVKKEIIEWSSKHENSEKE